MSLTNLFTEPRFDWYQVTFRVKLAPEDLFREARQHWDFADLETVKPKVRQYQHGAQISRAGRVIFHACWGGCNAGIHLIATGQTAHDVYLWLKGKYFPGYSVSRADVCLDTREPDVFDYLVSEQVSFANNRRIKQDQQGDWMVPGSPSGRTLYIGSRKTGSQAHTRTYEKGKQLGGNPEWVRFEAEIRPQSSDNKLLLSGLSPWEVLLSVKWLRDMVFHLFHLHDADKAEFQSISTTWSASDEQRAYMAMLRQYGNRLKKDAESLPGGWSDVGLKIQAYMELLEQHNRAIGGIGQENPYDEVLSRILFSA